MAALVVTGVVILFCGVCDMGVEIIHGDCLEVMRGMEGGSFDLVCTSPPYNLRNSTGNGMRGGVCVGKWGNAELKNGYDGYDDAMEYGEYVEWQRACLGEMWRLLGDRGAIFYNHKWRVQGGLLQDRSDIVSGFPVRQVIIWKRSGGVNFNRGYFLPTYEVIYLIAKEGFELAAGANRYGDVWEVVQDRGNEHPASFPVGLSDLVCSSVGVGRVLDPFMGSGTTGVSARKLGMDFVGIELSWKYCEMARSRLGVPVTCELF